MPLKLKRFFEWGLIGIKRIIRLFVDRLLFFEVSWDFLMLRITVWSYKRESSFDWTLFLIQLYLPLLQFLSVEYASVPGMGSSNDRCRVFDLYLSRLLKYSSKCFVFFKYLCILILQTLWLFLELLNSSEMMQMAWLYAQFLFVIDGQCYFLVVIRLPICVYSGLAFA